MRDPEARARVSRRALLASTIGLAMSGCEDPGPRLLPTHALPRVAGMRSRGLAEGQFLGKVTVLNVFGSWCGSCRAEHGVLMLLSERWSGFEMVGLAVADTDDDVRQYLEEEGNPFDAISLIDREYNIALSGYGVPRTFVVD